MNPYPPHLVPYQNTGPPLGPSPPSYPVYQANYQEQQQQHNGSHSFQNQFPSGPAENQNHPAKQQQQRKRFVGIKFTENELRESPDVIIRRLYEAAGEPCSTCGYRFKDKEKKATHLDWHFRKNSEEKKRSTKAASRDWFYPLEEWKEYQSLEEIVSGNNSDVELSGG